MIFALLGTVLWLAIVVFIVLFLASATAGWRDHPERPRRIQ